MIRKGLICMVIVLNVSGSLQAMFNGTKLSSIKRIRAYCSKLNTIKLPSAEKLKGYLYKQGFDHFVEKTKIDKDLGNKELYPLGVAVAVETHLYDYAQNVNNPMITTIMQMRKQQLIECILQDSPRELEELFKQLKYVNISCKDKVPSASRE